MRAPPDLADRVLVPKQLRLACAANKWLAAPGPASRKRRLDHAAVPHTGGAVDACACEHKRAVLVPIECEHFAPGRRHRQHRLRKGARERVRPGPGRVRGRAEVEQAERAIRRARRDEAGGVRAEGGLIYACTVRLQRLERMQPLGRPL